MFEREGVHWFSSSNARLHGDRRKGGKRRLAVIHDFLRAVRSARVLCLIDAGAVVRGSTVKVGQFSIIILCSYRARETRDNAGI